MSSFLGGIVLISRFKEPRVFQCTNSLWGRIFQNSHIISNSAEILISVETSHEEHVYVSKCLSS